MLIVLEGCRLHGTRLVTSLRFWYCKVLSALNSYGVDNGSWNYLVPGKLGPSGEHRFGKWKIEFHCLVLGIVCWKSDPCKEFPKYSSVTHLMGTQNGCYINNYPFSCSMWESFLSFMSMVEVMCTHKVMIRTVFFIKLEVLFLTLKWPEMQVYINIKCDSEPTKLKASHKNQTFPMGWATSTCPVSSRWTFGFWLLFWCFMCPPTIRPGLQTSLLSPHLQRSWDI